ncbi:MAG: homocysteine S-methyltransferase family protein, partial [Ilumatobacteraceae bacterium]
MNRVQSLRAAAAERILVLDGATGTEFQQLGLSDDDVRGERFHQHHSPLGGNHDILSLTQADALIGLHLSYLLAGADIITTNTFSSTTIAQREYGLNDPALIVEMNERAATLARTAAARAEEQDGRPRWVAGAMGPTNVTLSRSPRVDDPAFRTQTFAEIAQAYYE